ncbi:MAG: MATE family efflux transporter [Bacilli bacterium]
MQPVASKQKLILESKNLYQSILILSIPIFLSNFMKAFNDFVDMYFVSNFIEDHVSEAIAAISVTGPVFSISQALAGGMMIAGAAMMAQFLGAKQKERANKVAGQLLRLCLLAGFLMNALLFLLAPAIMTWMGASGVEHELMVTYVRVRSFEMIPLFGFFAFQASRQASGDTVSPFVLNVFMILVNILMTWVFIYYLHLGVLGAAFGTVIGHTILVPVFIWMMFHGKGESVSITMADVTKDSAEIKKLFQLAWPVSISQALTSLGFLLVNAFIFSYGQNTVNAFSVGNRINSLVLMPSMGIGGITATFVGQNIGAGNEKRARASVKAAVICATTVSVIGGLAILPFRETLGAIFLSRLPEALDLSVEYMFFLMTNLAIMGIFQVFMGSYQGSGETKFSLIMSMLRLWAFRLPLILLFKDVLLLPPSSLWYAMVISNFASLYVGIILYSKCKFQPKVRIQPAVA